VPRLCEFYPGICLTTEEKARKNLSQGKKNFSQVKKKPQSQYNIHITKNKKEELQHITLSKKLRKPCQVLFLAVNIVWLK
jgi:hypothetical protein